MSCGENSGDEISCGDDAMAHAAKKKFDDENPYGEISRGEIFFCEIPRSEKPLFLVKIFQNHWKLLI